MFTDQQLLEIRPKITNFANRLHHANRQEVEDLVHDTIVRMIEKKHLYDPVSPLSTWACKIMFNIFASRYRRRQKWEVSADMSRLFENLPERSCMENSYLVKQSMKKMDDYYPDFSQILKLESTGLQYNEMALLLNVPEGTVRSRLHRARIAIRELNA